MRAFLPLKLKQNLFLSLSIVCFLLGSVVSLRVLAAPTVQIDDPFEELVFDTRADLELVAQQAFGGSNRPAGWTGNVNVDSASVVADLWVDNEQLADQVFGVGTRPPGWIGATVFNAAILVRNVRHDLELTADEVYEPGQRPPEWRGSPVPYVVCDRTLQNVLALLNLFYNINSVTPDSALNYCQTVQIEIEDDLVDIVFTAPSETGSLLVPSELILGVRADLDRLVDQNLNGRPDGYIGERDRASSAYYADILLDLETVANQALGAGMRPPGWQASIPNNAALAYLTLRRNLELLADSILGTGIRPPDWQGTNALDRCEPLVRSLVSLARLNYQFTVDQIDVNAPDYCAQVTAAVNNLVESPPVLDVVDEAPEAIQRFTAASNFAFSYLDVAATLYMGVMPGGVPFRAVYRNYGESTMMFVTGADFALYVDQRFTDLEETAFRGLPTFNGAEPVTYCDAFWCNGPGPTPTPTGSGPLLQLLFQTTPVATPNSQALQITKQLVSWNYIRVTYVSDNIAGRTAQVALEICPSPATPDQTCEPVLSAFDNSIGLEKPVVSQFNGLNVYEFRYGYTQNLVIESETRYSNDLWISDPTIR